MNDFLLDHGLLHPSLVSSLKLPSLSALASLPLTVRIHPYLSEQGEPGCFRAEEGENKERSWVTKEKKRECVRNVFKESRQERSVV